MINFVKGLFINEASQVAFYKHLPYKRTVFYQIRIITFKDEEKQSRIFFFFIFLNLSFSLFALHSLTQSVTQGCENCYCVLMQTFLIFLSIHHSVYLFVSFFWLHICLSLSFTLCKLHPSFGQFVLVFYFLYCCALLFIILSIYIAYTTPTKLFSLLNIPSIFTHSNQNDEA